MQVGWLEAVLALAFLLLVANAVRRGFLREGSLLAGLGLALWAAGRSYQPVGHLLLPRDQAGPWPTVVYVSLVIVLLVLAAALSALAAPLVSGGPLRFIDRLAGFAVGCGEALLVVGLLLLAGERLGLARLPANGLAARSVEVAGLVLAWLTATVPREIVLLAH